MRSYGFDPASRITSLTDKQGTTSMVTAIGYDNLDRLTSAQGNVPGGFDQGFGYDLIGNRTSEALTLVSTTTTGPQIRTYSYDPASNRLASLTNPGVAYSYDAVGNIIGDGAVIYTYSGRNRLVNVKQGSATIATYQYNALGQRVAKTAGGASTLFAYDNAGHLMGEYDGTGAVNQETVWLNDTPVATLRKSGASTAIHYVWADHLDTPRAITTSDAAGTLEWSWDSDPFGTSQPNAIALTYNLRFPGQYFDAETAKHYNYFRDYDPALGRYVESDPIGLLGGLSTYAYVGGGPLVAIDSQGLLADCKPIAIGPWLEAGQFRANEKSSTDLVGVDYGLGPTGGPLGSGDPKAPERGSPNSPRFCFSMHMRLTIYITLFVKEEFDLYANFQRSTLFKCEETQPCGQVRRTFNDITEHDKRFLNHYSVSRTERDVLRQVDFSAPTPICFPGPRGPLPNGR